MKYKLFIDQGTIIEWQEAEDSKGKKLDWIDCGLIAFIESLADPKRSLGMRRNKNNLVWLSHENILEQLPLLYISSKNALARRLRKIEEIGIIRAEVELTCGGRKCFYGLSNLYYEIERWWELYKKFRKEENWEALEALDRRKPKVRKKGKKIIKFQSKNRDENGKFTKKVINNQSLRTQTPIGKTASLRTQTTVAYGLTSLEPTDSDHRIFFHKDSYIKNSYNEDFLSFDFLKKEEKKILIVYSCSSCKVDLTSQHKRGDERGFLPETCLHCGEPDKKAIAWNRELGEAAG